MFVLIYNVDYFRSFIYGNNLSKINIRTNFKKRDSNTVQIEGFSDGNIDGISIQATKDGKFSASGKFDGTWNSIVGLATKDDFNYTDVRITTSANNSIAITEAPKGSEYIPVIVAHRETNNCQDTVTYDGGIWKICSTVSQETAIRFYHMPIS